MAEAQSKAQAEASAAQPVRLEDYRPPDYLVDQVELRFDLQPAATEVRARLAVRRNPAAGRGAGPLVLDGQELELIGLALDGEALGSNRYQVDDDHLIVHDVPAAFTLETTVRIRPDAQHRPEGLYLVQWRVLHPVRARGLSPDHLVAGPARRDVALPRADRGRPGGVPGAAVQRQSAGDRRAARRPALGRCGRTRSPSRPICSRWWPATSPASRTTFTTRSGRTVQLRIYSEHANIDQCHHAMASLKKCDEVGRGPLRPGVRPRPVPDRGGQSDFNFGAMENKGLNIFNTKYVLAEPETATDADFLNVERIIAHEYFHNWTGDRVTCRDWFQLTLKEGLTVFRDQQFTADMHSRAVKRIGDVRRLRDAQFAEDAGPLAHPIRPDRYIEINNFYTGTVYQKGAEVIRMLHTLIGEEAFQRGMRLYFERYDGQAVTCEDFVAAAWRRLGPRSRPVHALVRPGRHARAHGAPRATTRRAQA